MENKFKEIGIIVNQLLQIIEQSDAAISNLMQEADNQVSSYWDYHIYTNKRKTTPEKSILGCRIKNGGGIYIQWFWNRYVPVPTTGNKIKMQPYSQHIKIGKSQKYTSSSLSRRAQDWEIDTILEFEEIFSTIRKLASTFVQIRKRAREALKLIEQQSPSSLPCDDTSEAV